MAVARAELWFWPAVLVILVVSIPLHPQWLVSDVSWLITVCEKMLEGKRLYLDILETNLPGAVLIYMPPVVFARIVGILPETAVVAQTYLVGLLALWLAWRALPATVGDGHSSKFCVLLPAAVIMFALPLQAFAQREHYAAMLSFPLACCFVRFADERAWPEFSVRTAAVVLAALMLTIKPIFALPGLFLMLYCWWLSRSFWAVWRSGIVFAGLLGAAVTLLSLLVFPAYLANMLPIVTNIYAPYRVVPFYLIFTEPTGAAAVISAGLAALVIWKAGKSSSLVPFLVAAFGYLAGFYIHGKGYPYQAYPAVFFALIPPFAIIASRFPRLLSADGWRVAEFLGLALSTNLSLGLAIGGNSSFPIPMRDTGWAEGLHRPTVMSLSPANQTGFPLVRRIGGDWVDVSSGMWISYYARWALNQAADYNSQRRTFQEESYASDLRNAVERVNSLKPYLIIVDKFRANAWLLPQLLAIDPDLLADYVVLAEDESVTVMKRR